MVDDFFGLLVSISEKYILIGTHQDNTGAENAGSAYLFDTSGNLLHTYNNPTPEFDDQFGISVSVLGDYVLVGAFGDNTGASNAGSAYLFDTSGNLLHTYNNPTPEGGDEFAFSLSISGNNVLVGGYRDNTGAKNAGSAYLFDTSGNLLHTFNNPTPELNDQFGESVKIFENHILIGAVHDNTGAENAGSAYLFDTSGNLLHTFNNPTPELNDYFGDEVSISENHILIGARGDNTGAENAGSAYLFDTSGNLLHTYNNPTPMPDDRLSHSVSIWGDYIILGAHLDDTGAKNAGSAYLFDTSGNLLHTYNNPTPMPTDRFGHSVSIWGDFVLIDANADDTGAENAGSVYLYDRVSIILPNNSTTLPNNPTTLPNNPTTLPNNPTTLLLTEPLEIISWLIPVVLAVGIGLVIVRRKYFANHFRIHKKDI